MLRTFQDDLAQRLGQKKPPPTGPTPPAQPVGPIYDRTKRPPLGQPPGDLPLGDPNAPPPIPLDPPSKEPSDPVRMPMPDAGGGGINPLLSLAPSSGPTTDVQPLRMAGPMSDFAPTADGSPYSPILTNGDMPLGDPNALPPSIGGPDALGSPPVTGDLPLGDPTKPPPIPTGPKEPAKPEGQIYGPGQYPVAPPDFNTIAGQDVPEAKMPGYVWHHNGTGWDLRPASRVGEGAGGAAGAGGETPQTLEQTLQSKLSELMKRSDVVGRDDPAIAGALAANRLSEQRGSERARATLAEQAAREGGGADSGAFRSALTGLNESRAAREGQYAGGMILDETRQRRDQLQQVLALTGNMLDAKEKNKIQEELGRLNAEVSRYGISEGGRQFDAGLQEKIREYGLDDLFRNKGLDASTSSANASRGESGRQFDINQAQQQAQWEAEFNRQSLLDILNAMGY